MPKIAPQARYWMLTIPHAEFTPYLPPNCAYIRGQLELGTSVTNRDESAEFSSRPDPSSDNSDQLDRQSFSGSDQHEGLVDAEKGRVDQRYLHWQVVVIFKSKIRLGGVRDIFGRWHAEPVRSDSAALEYVWKAATSIEGTKFEIGKRPLRASSITDWDLIRSDAKSGHMDNIPSNIYVLHYNNLRRIAQDHLQPSPQIRQVVVYWGLTGVGKSRRAWNEAGLSAYPKDPRSKFWDGYRGQDNVVIDEFRGDIDIGHILRWFDRYPCIVEVKGSSVVLSARSIWITSNINPIYWYPMLDEATRDALMRRLIVVEMTEQNTNLLDLICAAPEMTTDASIGLAPSSEP